MLQTVTITGSSNCSTITFNHIGILFIYIVFMTKLSDLIDPHIIIMLIKCTHAFMYMCTLIDVQLYVGA